MSFPLCFLDKRLPTFPISTNVKKTALFNL